jgi:ABC-type antimicrobial peptide transport system permease subunit
LVINLISLIFNLINLVQEIQHRSMTEQQQQQQRSGTGASGTGGRYPPSQLLNSTGNKDSGGNKGSGNNNNNDNNNSIKANKKNAARDRKKARNKLQKKDRPVENFMGAIKDTGHLMYGIVITPSVGNMADQCHVFIKQIKLLCNGENMYRLESSITTRTIMCSDDFYSTMPDPLLYSTMTKDADGNSIYIVTNPAQKMEFKTVWS